MISVGNLVKHDEIFGIVTRKYEKTFLVFLGNGLTVEAPEDDLKRILIPSSSAPYSFHELLKGREW